MGELKKTMGNPADDKSKAAVKNKFCSSGGEMLGTRARCARWSENAAPASARRWPRSTSRSAR